jgi:hypothetical protein
LSALAWYLGSYESGLLRLHHLLNQTIYLDLTVKKEYAINTVKEFSTGTTP